MFYNKADITCHACMNGTVYFLGHPDIMSEIQYIDGTFDLRLILTPENIERLLTYAKETDLV